MIYKVQYEEARRRRRPTMRKWKLLHSEFVLNERWYRVRKDTVEVRPGHIVDDYYLGVFNDIVLVVAVTADKHIPLVRQYKHGAGEIVLELPAGYMENGEDPLTAAKRELREETGFTAATWHTLGVFFKNSAKTSGDNIHLFLALDARKTDQQHLDENEEIEVVMTPFAEAVSLAWSGKLQAGDTVLALLLAEKELKLIST